MNIRERTEQLERETLSPLAMLAENSAGRASAEKQCDLRTDFARDRDRIIHCKSFRRLKQKTQVFLSPEGDHYRTRLTHTLEVSQIARTISRALRLNEDLTEAIALGHDLGHTPFGHAGERALDKLCPGGFCHYLQSVRVVEKLERDRRGLNLTAETIDGIRNHTKDEWAKTLEGRVVRHADRIAYLNHDIEDAVTAKVFSESLIPKRITDVLGHSKSQRITTLITSLIENSNTELCFADEVREAFDELYKFMFDNVYLNLDSAAKCQENKVEDLLSMLFERFRKKPELMPELYVQVAEQEGAERAATDYISGMSDAFAVSCFEEMFIPDAWTVK